jgi:hypothetical protein
VRKEAVAPASKGAAASSTSKEAGERENGAGSTERKGALSKGHGGVRGFGPKVVVGIEVH